MKQLLITFLFAFSFALQAANPSFSSFNTDQFGTANNRVVVKDSALLTNIVAKGTVTVNPGGASTPTFTSTVADGASAVAFRMASSNYLSNSDAYFLRFVNFNTNIFSIDATGNTFNRSITFTEPGGGDEYVFINAYGIVSEPDATELRLVPSQTGATPFLFNTHNAVSTGNIIEAQNNATNKFTVDYLGGVTTGLPTGATNAHPFKIGAKSDAVGLVLVATNYIQIEVNGVLYKMALVQ